MMDFGWFGQTLLELALPPLVTAIAGLLVAVLTRYLGKVGIDLDRAQQERAKELIRDAIRATEEAARRRAAQGVVMTSEQKRKMTETTVLETVQNMPPGQVDTVIDSQLQVVRAENTQETTTARPRTGSAEGLT